MCESWPKTKLLDCYGEKICSSCLENVYVDLGVCPYCRQKFKVLLEKSDEPKEFKEVVLGKYDRPKAHTNALQELQTQNTLYVKKLKDYENRRENFIKKQERLAELARDGYDVRNKVIPEVPLIDFLSYKKRVCRPEDLDQEFLQEFLQGTRDPERFGHPEENEEEEDEEDEEENHLLRALKSDFSKLDKMFKSDEKFAEEAESIFPKKMKIQEIQEFSKKHRLDMSVMLTEEFGDHVLFVLFIRGEISMIYKSTDAPDEIALVARTAELDGKFYRLSNLLVAVENQWHRPK